MENILIIDDDVCIGDMLEEVLTKEGYHIARCYSGTEAILYLSSTTPDLILLDLMLPGMSGEDVLSKIKNMPVIILSAKTDMDDKVELLLNGAADYITKPFDTRELLARIKVQLRQSAHTDRSILHFHDLSLNMNTHEVLFKDALIKLTRTEYAILKLLMSNPSQVIPKSVILDKISDSTPDCMESSLKVHVSNLRKKLREIGKKDYIEAVWGIGFKMKEE